MKKTILCAAAALFLSACGGGSNDTRSGDSQSLPPPPSIQGTWHGVGHTLLATPAGEIWGIDLQPSQAGVIKGAITTGGDSFNATWTTYFGPEKAYTLASGKFTEKQKISGSTKALITESETTPLELTYDSSFDATPNLSSLKGSYFWIGGPGETGLSITETGAITTEYGDCSMSGQIRLDGSGKNFYRLTMTYGSDAACDVPGGTAEGFLLPPRSQGDGNNSSGGVPGAPLVIGGVISGDIGRAMVLIQQQ